MNWIVLCLHVQLPFYRNVVRSNVGDWWQSKISEGEKSMFFRLGNFPSSFILKASLSLSSLIKHLGQQWSFNQKKQTCQALPPFLSFNSKCCGFWESVRSRCLLGFGWSGFFQILLRESYCLQHLHLFSNLIGSGSELRYCRIGRRVVLLYLPTRRAGLAPLCFKLDSWKKW